MADGIERRFVSRGGLKLDHALRTFGIDVAGLRCADLGCSTGGFVDCLLQHGARSVEAVDTGYGVLAWSLRQDPRVTVRERTNALHAEPATPPVDLVTIDLGWTPQRLALPVALRWLAPEGQIVTLVKPHYEATGGTEGRAHGPRRGGLADEEAMAIFDRFCAAPPAGLELEQWTPSPIRGAKSARHGAGNLEFLALLRRNRDGADESPKVPIAT